MADLLSYMSNNHAALSEGLRAFFADSLISYNSNDWRVANPDRERKQVAWYRLKEARPQTDEYRWRAGTERHVNREIKKRTPSGKYLKERRNRVLAALGMTYEAALSKLTFEGKGAEA